jgi:signal transduction histidine kinase
MRRMRLRPRSVTLLAALVAGGFTDLVVMVPAVHFAYRSPAVHAMLEVTATLIAFLTTVLVWGRLRWRQGLDDLLLFAALGLLSVTSLLFAVIPAAVWTDPHAFSTWATFAAGGLSAALLAMAALVRPFPLRNYEHAGRLAVVALGTAMVAIGTIVGALVDRLPIGIDPARSPLNVPGPISGNVVIVVAQVVIGLLFLAAAIGFTRRADATGDEFFLWLGAGAVFAAFARMNYFIFPSLYSEWVYTGDVLRLCWHILLFIGAVREIRVYQRVYAEARVLEERRRIARDLHDGLAQELAFIANKTRELAVGTESRPALLQLASAAQRGLDESRRAIDTLTRTTDEPFEAALRRTVEEVADRLGTRVKVDTEPAPDITPGQREQLLRIVREAVTNAGCHADADFVHVQLTNGGPLQLRVEDDGVGFDPAEVSSKGFGLVTMEERALAIGAEFRINSTKGRGTAVEVRL